MCRRWFSDTMYSVMSCTRPGEKAMCGIVSRGDRSSARSEYSLIEGPAANSGNVGASRLGESDRDGRPDTRRIRRYTSNSPAVASAVARPMQMQRTSCSVDLI